MELFRELFSVHTGAPFTTNTRLLSHMDVVDTVHIDVQHTQVNTQHLLGSLTLASATDVTQMFGWHLGLQEGQRKTEELLVYPKNCKFNCCFKSFHK